MKLAGVVCRDETGCGFIRHFDRVNVVKPVPDLYTVAGRLVKHAVQLKSDAVWPAWGFLAEDPGLAAAVSKAGLLWVGPSPETLALLGNKTTAREAALEAGLPVLPQTTVTDLETGADQVAQLINRYPLILKSTVGGGGKGQVVVDGEDELGPLLARAWRTNLELYGCGDLVAEPFVTSARHIEVQFARDSSGGFLALGTRDCTVQRRFQKVIEEGPAPGIEFPCELVAGMARLAGNIEYVTAGTVEFLFDGKEFFFMEVNPRLQVEHPVTEETSRLGGRRLDLLELMLVCASGGKLPVTQEQVEFHGHAVEARIYAEDISRGNLPETGSLSHAGWPGGEGIRVDSAVAGAGEKIFPRYDPMLGKVIASGVSRDEAVDRLARSLDATSLLGVSSNIPQVRSALRSEAFRRGEHTTSLLEEIEVQPNLTVDLFLLAGSLAAYDFRWQEVLAPCLDDAGFDSVDEPPRRLTVRMELFGAEYVSTVWKLGPELYLCRRDGQSAVVTAFTPEADVMVVQRKGADAAFFSFHISGNTLELSHKGDYWRARFVCGKETLDADPHLAPTGGMVRRILVEAGQQVHPGNPLYILETMKMETEIAASWEGKVAGVNAREGDTVEMGQPVVQITADAGPADPEVTPEETDYGCGLLEAIQSPFDLVLDYFLGYDGEAEDVEELFAALEPARQVKLLERIVGALCSMEKARSDEHLYSILYLIGTGGEGFAGKDSLALLRKLSGAYGYKDQALFCTSFEPVSRLVAVLMMLDERRATAIALLGANSLWGKKLVTGVGQWYQTLSPLFAPTRRAHLLSLISEQDPKEFYNLSAPPVAEEYWEEWIDHQLLLRSAPPPIRDGFDLEQLPLKKWLTAWFEDFELSPVLTRRIEGMDVYLVEATYPDTPPRLLAVARIDAFEPTYPIKALPPIERAAIECYRLIARTENRVYQSNHVFMIVDDDAVFQGGVDGLTVDSSRIIAARVAGFARGLKIDATEVALNFDEGYRLLEVRHAPDVGIISRPPYCLSERRSENDPERWLDSRQQRMGKLLNRDRARLLFEDGEFQRVEVPGIEGDTLDLFAGTIGSVKSFAYANDFRRKGGAVGEREGKKLTLAVLYAYFEGMPLVGIHDGAGANVKESITSLAWAGAYFGAIAATGGVSDPETFRAWWEGHIWRPELEEHLTAMGVTDFAPRPPLVHVHLHLGASVGMLVYGPSISSLSIMVDHRNVYRVLTGSRAVRLTTGEQLSNYLLGGAPVHGEVSGDVALVCATEGQAISRAVELLSGLKTDRPRCRPELVGHTYWTVTENAACVVEIEALKQVLDEGFFYELRRDLREAHNVITVVSRLGGAPVVAAAIATRTAVTSGAGWKKLYQAVRLAHDLRLPFVMALAVEPRPAAASPACTYHLREFEQALEAAPVPKVAILLGSGAESGSTAARFDVTVAMTTKQETGSVSKALTALTADGFSAAWRTAAAFLSTAVQPCIPRSLDDAGEPEGVPSLPDKLAAPYDMRGFIGTVVDPGSFLELWGADDLPLITGLATVRGRAIALLADDPQVAGGAQTMAAITKFTRFGRLAERYGIPMVQFSDSPAFMPGSVQERLSIQAEGGKSLLEESLSSLPRLGVTLRQNYGGRLIHANLPTLGPPRTGIAWNGARMGVMGADGAAAVLLTKRRGAKSPDAEFVAKWKDDYIRDLLSPKLALDAGIIEQLVELPELRDEIEHWLARTQHSDPPSQVARFPRSSI